jgi:hypothetical protein
VNDEILLAIDARLATLQQARDILTAALPSTQPGAPRRQLSAKARKAIADGQRKRWAKVRSQKKASDKEPAGS